MYLLVILLLFGIFFPVLLIPLFLFAVFMFFFLPFKFTIDSLFNLFSVPKQLYQIATNPKLRKNHGLEHATINILEKEYGYNDLAGYAEEDGFYIMGVNNNIYVEEAARKGLNLMKNGKNELAIHKRCGTSMTVANFLSAIIFLFLLFTSGYFSILNMIIAIVVANLIGPYLGQIVQRKFTTTSEVKEMEIKKSYFAEAKSIFNQPVKIFVETEQIPYINQE
ncbi:MAG: DUF6391 domain-containing protein [Bacillota bacterium]